MTYDETLKALDALYAANGRDYVVHAGNHPDILRAWNDHSVELMEREMVSRDQEQTSGG